MMFSGKQIEEFHRALSSAFTPAELRRLLALRMSPSRDLYDYDIASGNFQDMVFQLIRKAESQGWTADLLIAAREEKPYNQTLNQLAQLTGLASHPEAIALTGVVDPYLIDTFDAYEANLSSAGEQVSRLPTMALPMLLRVASPNWQPDPAIGNGIEITTRLGVVIACRATREAVLLLQADPAVLAVEASRPGGVADCARSLPFVHADTVHISPNLQEKGSSALVAVIDGGIDVLHEAFRDEHGKTRIYAIWDQTDSTGLAPDIQDLLRFGTLHTRSDIDGYIADGKVPPGLGRDEDGHGTHVASIACGRPVGDFYGGVAPEATLVVVIPKLDVNPQDSQSLGYSTSHAAALKFIEHAATTLDRPVVVNVSLGMNSGAHDGTSLLEEAFDQFSEGGRKRGRVIVKSAGNERASGGHSQLTLPAASEVELTWASEKNHWGPDVLELWFPAWSTLQFQVIDPAGEGTPWVGADNRKDHVFDTFNRCSVSYTKYHWDNGDSRLQVTLHRGKASNMANGTWRLVIRADPARSSGTVHAWIERAPSRPIRLTNHLSEAYTLSIPGTARSVISVASVDAAKPYRVASYSSAGPTRDGREKPDLAAPGERILAAKGGSFRDIRPENGTSMAAPHVTGSVALLLSRRVKRQLVYSDLRQLNANQIRRALTLLTQDSDGRFTVEMGYGVLDVQQLVEEFE